MDTAIQVLTGLDDEAYQAASEAAMDNAMGNETTVAFEIEGLSCMIKSILGDAMLYISLADAA